MIPLGAKVRSRMDDSIQGVVQAHVFCEASSGDPLENSPRKCLVKAYIDGSILVVLEEDLEIVR